MTPNRTAVRMASRIADPGTRATPAPPPRETSATPATARTMPAYAAVGGRSPSARPTATGTTTCAAMIGATTLIAPSARAR